MDTTELKENPLEAQCFYIREWSYDRKMLEGIVKAEEVVIDGIKMYNPFRAYCSLARDKPEDFRQVCPAWLKCSYANGETRDVKPKNAE